MTTVVGYARGQHTILAGDSATNVYDRPVISAVKVRRYRTTSGDGSYLLGFAGDGAGPAIVSRHHSVERLPNFADRADRDGWAAAIGTAITEAYTDHLLLSDGRMDSNLLLAARGHLWTITHHQAIPHPDGLGAIGSGEGPALGALHALLARGEHPVDAVVQACKVGILLDRYSDAPVRLAVA